MDVAGDTSIPADTDSEIDIKIAGAYDFQFTANTFTALSGSTRAAQAITATKIGATGVVTANAGVVVDNITIDGTEIDLSSGDLTIDVASNITLDADGGDIFFKDGGTSIAQLALNNTGNFDIYSAVSDADIRLRGNDGGSTVTALTLDMSDAGAATLNNGLTLTDGDLTVASGHGINFAATGDGSGTDTSELLADYEEGTWTPAYTSTSASFSYSSQYGTYVKVGGFVHLQFYLLATASGTTSNTTTITGLPYAVANLNSLHQSGASVWFTGSVDIRPLFNNSQSSINLWKKGAVATATAAEINNVYLVGSGSYRAS